MSKECTWLRSCPFFISSRNGNDKIEKLKECYCKGDYQSMCIRKIYKEIHGDQADPRMGPDGKLIDSED